MQTFYDGSFNLGATSGSLALGPIAHAFGHRTMFACAAAMASTAFLLFAVGTRYRRGLAAERSAQ